MKAPLPVVAFALLIPTAVAACGDADAPRLRAFLSVRHPATSSAPDGDGGATAGALDVAPMPDVGADEPGAEPDDGADLGAETSGDVMAGGDLAGSDGEPEANADVASDAEPGPGEPDRYPEDRVLSPLSPGLVAGLQALAEADPTLSDDVFIKVGASTSVSGSFLKCFAGTAYDLGSHGALQSTRDFFAGGDAAGSDPFSRSSLAAKGGVSAGWALTGSPSPLEQELAAASPRFALVHYGTNDMGLGATYLSALFPFAENLWNIIDLLRDRGVIPVLATIQRRGDRASADLWVPTYNGVIRAIAQGRQIPLVDMWLANEGLPDHGLASDGVHSAVYPEGACILTDAGLRYGMNHRNLQVLTMLSRLEAAVLDGEASDPPQATLSGLGTPEDPVVIPALPFHDLRDTRSALSDTLDTYDGCGAPQDERGPEVIYALDVGVMTRVRVTVHDLGATDVDLHLLDETASTAGCLARHHQVLEATLQPGRWHLALDTFVSGGGTERSGEYLLSVVPCPADDPDCG
jgi:hypothetical protein